MVVAAVMVIVSKRGGVMHEQTCADVAHTSRNVSLVFKDQQSVFFEVLFDELNDLLGLYARARVHMRACVCICVCVCVCVMCCTVWRLA
jgi:hypothetical protein